MRCPQERQEAAESQRAQLLDEVRQRATQRSVSVGHKRETVANRLSQRQEELAQRMQQQLAAAEERRNALQEAERERLRAEHELVLTRLVRPAWTRARSQRAAQGTIALPLHCFWYARAHQSFTACAARAVRAAATQALSKEETSPSAEEARRRIEERLAAADEQRQQRLAQAALKAGSKVQHAKVRRGCGPTFSPSLASSSARLVGPVDAV